METELDLRDYIRIIRKRIWLILSVVVISSMITGLVSLFVLEPVYEASTKLIVNQSRTDIGLSEIDINTVNLNIRLIDTYKEIIKTPAIMNKVAEQHPEWKLSSEQLVGKVQVSSVNNTQVMTLVVQDLSQSKAANIVNAISNVFIEEISTLMQVDNVFMLSEAVVLDNPQPVKPNPILNIAISFVVSLMISVGIVFLIEYFDDSIKTEQDVMKYLNLPTLAMIPKVKPEDLDKIPVVVTSREVGEKYQASVNT
ncbi:MAG: Wzz/FepE/Etk N-terminal domain-containing protein [Paenibacillaceae bacterium]